MNFLDGIPQGHEADLQRLHHNESRWPGLMALVVSIEGSPSGEFPNMGLS